MAEGFTEEEVRAIVPLLERFFVHRRDTYTVQLPEGGYNRVPRPLEPGALRRHLLGEVTIGVYQAEKGAVRWNCFDLDEGDRDRLREKVSALRRAALEAGVPPEAMLVEDSGRRGAHLWIFFSEPVPVRAARLLGLEILERSGVTGAELFPKQEEVPPDGFGNLVKLPLGIHRVSGRRAVFVDPETLEPLGWRPLERVRPWAVPTELLERLSSRAPPPKEFSPLLAEGDLPCWVRLSEGRVPEGRRHLAAFALARHLRDRRLSRTAVEAVMREWFGRLPQPPEAGARFDWRDVERAIEDAFQRGYPVGCETIRRDFPELCVPECPLRREKRGGEGKPEEYLPVRVSDLCAEMVGKKVVVDGQIVAESTGLVVPKVLEVECTTCGEIESFDLFSSPDLLKKYILEGTKAAEGLAVGLFRHKKRKCLQGKEHSPRIRERDYLDRSFLLVRDLPRQLGEEKFERRIFKPRPFHLVGALLPPTQKVRLWGEVGVDQKQQIVVVCTRIEPLETEAVNFTFGEKEKEEWVKYFTSTPPHLEIAPSIVGRDLAKKFLSLTYHSPPRIPTPEGEVIRGYLLVAFFGDTTTGKSKTAKDLTEASESAWPLPLGTYFCAETGGRTGLLYTVDNDRKMVIWGDLVLNDLGLVVVDGLDRLSPEEFAEFRETLRTGRVLVRKAQREDAWARTRIIACFNPKGAMRQFLFPCQAISSTWTFQDPTHISRWDVFIPFSQDDVRPEEWIGKGGNERPIPPEIFASHVFWAWSRKPDQIRYEREAAELLREAAVRLIENYSSQSLPVVSNEAYQTLCRLAVARAVERHSTDGSHQEVIVKREHVESVVDDYEEVLRRLKLAEYVAAERGELRITEDEFKGIVRTFDQIDWDILDHLKMGALSSEALAEKLEVSSRTVRERYEKLKRYRLITTARRVGAELTPRGVALLKRYHFWEEEEGGEEKTRIAARAKFWSPLHPKLAAEVGVRWLESGEVIEVPKELAKELLTLPGTVFSPTSRAGEGEKSSPPQDLVPINPLRGLPGREKEVVDLQGGEVVKVPLEPGRVVWVSRKTAETLVKGGYAEYLSPPEEGEEGKP